MVDITTVETETLYQKYQKAADMADAGDEQAARDAKLMGDELRRRQSAATAEAAPQGENFGNTAAGQAISGINEGFYSNVLGAPASIMRGIQGVANLPARGVNAAAEALGYEGDLLPVSDYPGIREGVVASPEWWQDRMRDEDSLYADVVGGPASVPPDPDHPIARRMGEYTGVGLAATLPVGRAGTPGRGGGGLADTVATAAARPGAALTFPAAEAAAAGASVLGGEVGAALGGEDWRATGEILGGFAPALAFAGGQRGAAALLGDETSPERYIAAQTANVPASPGLVGNQAARVLEQASTINPLASRLVTRKQGQQTEAISDAFDRIGAEMRPEGVPPARNPYTAGVRVSEAVQQTDPVTGRSTGILPDLEKELARLENIELDTVGGANQALDVKRIDAALERQIQSASPDGRAALRELRANLETVRDTPIDQALHDQITTRMGNRTTRLQQLESIPPERRTPAETRSMRNLRYRLRLDAEQLDANMGVKAGVLDKWRKEIGQGTQTRSRVAAGEARQVYGAVRGTQRAEALTRGMLDEQLAATAEKRRISGSPGLATGGEIDFARSLASKEPEKIYEAVTSKDAAGKILAMKRLMSEDQFNTMAADIFATMARPKSQHATAADYNTPTFSASEFGTRWKNLPPETQKALIPNDGIRKDLEDVLTLSDSLTKRGRIQSGPQTASILGSAAFGGAFMSDPITTTGLATTHAAATNAFMTDALASVIARQYPELAQQIFRPTTRVGAQQALGEDSE